MCLILNDCDRQGFEEIINLGGLDSFLCMMGQEDDFTRNKFVCAFNSIFKQMNPDLYFHFVKNEIYMEKLMTWTECDLLATVTFFF